MYLVSSLPKFEDFTMVSPKFQPCRAANQATTAPGRDAGQITVDLNKIVTHVAGDVAARVNASTVDIQLKLSPGRLDVSVDEEVAAFVLSGLLVAMVRTLDEDGTGHARIQTEQGRDEVVATVTTSGGPSIATVRAVESRDFDGDPTIAHCRRLLEDNGGQLRLTDAEGHVGICVAMPRTTPQSDQQRAVALPHFSSNRADKAIAS